MKTKKKKKGFLEGYKKYDSSEGFGNPDEWRGVFFERMGVTKAMEVLGEISPFSFFGLQDAANWDDVRRAYMAASLKFHPDHGGTVKEMQLVNAAYEVLEERFGKA